MTSRDSACAVWDLTIPKDKITVEDLKHLLSQDCKKWAFQLERGSQSGYEHYQARISLEKKQRQHCVVELFKEISAHVSRTSNANMKNEFYVLKNDTRLDGPWTDRDKELPVQYRNPPEKWYVWQKQVLDIIEQKPDERRIYVIFDPIGKHGKSFLRGYLGCRNLVCSIPPLNDFKDIMRMICDRPTSKTYMIDIPRGMDKKKMNNLIGAIEELKNGYAFDERYSFKEKWFDTPHIFIFTNVEFDKELLSADRWLTIYPTKEYVDVQ